MKPVPRAPRFFPEVLQAVYELREIGGSQVNKITHHVRNCVLKKSHHGRNVGPLMSVQIRKALKHAVDRGVLRYRAGKYRIETRKRQIKADKRDPLKDCAACRRAKRKREEERRKNRKNKHRKAAVVPMCNHAKRNQEQNSLTEESTSRSRSPPTKKVKAPPVVDAKKSRPRRRLGRKRRGAKSKIGKQVPEANNNRKKQQSKIAEQGPSQPETFYMNKSQGDENQLLSRECDNPDCLCNSIKKEKGDANPTRNPQHFDDNSDDN